MVVLDSNGLAAAPECVGRLRDVTTLSLRHNRIETLPPEVRQGTLPRDATAQDEWKGGCRDAAARGEELAAQRLWARLPREAGGAAAGGGRNRCA